MAKVTTIIPRDVRLFERENLNVYETIVIMGRRARQISTKIKEELKNKLKDFESSFDTMEEMHENREQIEISRYYERMQKCTTQAIEEYLDGKIMFKNPNKESDTTNGSENDTEKLHPINPAE